MNKCILSLQIEPLKQDESLSKPEVKYFMKSDSYQTAGLLTSILLSYGIYRPVCINCDKCRNK